MSRYVMTDEAEIAIRVQHLVPKSPARFAS